MGFFLILSLFLSILVTLSIFLSYWNQRKLAKLLPPGPPPLPLLGNPTYIIRDAAHKHYSELQKKYGPMFTVWRLMKPIVVLCGYDVVKDALVNHGEQFSERPPLPTADIDGTGFSLASDVKSWRQIRRFMLSSMRKGGMGKTSIEVVIHEEFQKLFSVISETKGKAFLPIHLLGFTVYSIISSLLFGENLDYKDPKLINLIVATRKYIQCINSTLYEICNTFPVLLKLLFVKEMVRSSINDVHHIVTQYVDARRKSTDINSPKDFLDSWIMKLKEEESKPGTPFCDSSVPIHVGGLLAAGTDTTTSSLTFCLLIMAHFPEIQETVQREIDEVVGHGRLPGIKDRPEMPYTNAVIHECQRTLNLAPIGFYHATAEDMQFRGFFIPKAIVTDSTVTVLFGEGCGLASYPLIMAQPENGSFWGLNGTIIIAYLSSVLSDPAYWKNPDEFYPDHFLDKGQFKPNPAFMPFSAGPRACLGENLARKELFLIFSALLQKFTFKNPPGVKGMIFKSVKNSKKTFLLSSQVCAVSRSIPSRSK